MGKGLFGWKKLFRDPESGTFKSPVFGQEWNTDEPTQAQAQYSGIHAGWSDGLVAEYPGDSFIVEGGGDAEIGERGWNARAAIPIASVENEVGAQHFGIPNVSERVGSAIVRSSRKRFFPPDVPVPYKPIPISPNSGVPMYEYDEGVDLRGCAFVFGPIVRVLVVSIALAGMFAFMGQNLYYGAIVVPFLPIVYLMVARR